MNPLVWLSGADPQIIKRCRTDRAKYSGIGSAMLVTGALAGSSAAFASFTALHTSLPVSITIGVFWAMGIISLDRWLVASMQRQKRWWRNLLIALPRVALAVLIGFVVSTPLVLRIFQPEIQSQINDIHRVAAEKFDSDLQNGGRAQRIETLKTQIKNDNSTIATNTKAPDVSNDPQVKDLQAQVDKYTAMLVKANHDYQCESDGTCGTGVVGDQGAQAQAKKAYRDSVAVQLGQFQTQLETAQKTATAKAIAAQGKQSSAAQTRVTDNQTELTKLVNEQQAEIDSFTKRNNDNTGLLIRIEALGQLTDSHPDMKRAHLLLLLFITAFECLPVLVKTLLQFGDPTLYEKAVAKAEEEQLPVEEELARRRRAAQLLDSEDELIEAQIARAAKDGVIERLTTRSIASQERVATAALTAWEERELGRVRAEPAGAEPAGYVPLPTMPQR